MNAFKQALVGTYSDSDTVIELNSISDTVGAPDYLVSGVPLILYDSLFGNPADSNNAGDYEIVLVTGVNYATNEITVTRAQESTTAQTIGTGWSAVYGLTQAGLDGKINVDDIVNDLTTGGTTVPLSAEQGKVLQDNKLNKNEFTEATAKSDFTDTDSFLRWDSVSGALRRFTWANLKTALGSLHNVKDFGAVGDGSENDTTAIQNALNHIKSIGGGTLYFPAGTYMSNRLYYNEADNLTILGEDRGSTILKLIGQTAGGSGWGGVLNISGTSATLSKNIKISDITFDGNRDNITPDGGMTDVESFDMEHVDGFYVSNCNFIEGYAEGFDADHVFNGTIINCYAENCGKFGFHVTREGAGQHSENVNLTSCFAKNCGNYEPFLSQSGRYRGGINVNYGRNLNVMNCTLIDNAIGIIARNELADSTFTGNKMYGSKIFAFAVASGIKNCVISKNVIDGACTEALDNPIAPSNIAALRVTGAVLNNIITDNFIKNVDTYDGVFLGASSNGNRVLDNIFDGVDGDDIVDTGTNNAVPIVSLDFSADSNFSAGTAVLVRVGNTVTLQINESATHSSSSEVSTAVGFIPEGLRPRSLVHTIYTNSASAIRRIAIATDGSITFTYRDYSGSFSNQTTTGSTAVITYCI